MAHAAAKIEAGTAYLDGLTLSSFRDLLQQKGLIAVILLDPIRPRRAFWRWLLERRGIRIREATFFTGHLKTKDGESIRRVSRKTAAHIAFSAARGMVQSEPTIRRLNEMYERNTILLFIAKQLHAHIEYWTDRALVAQALCFPGRAHVWLKKPVRFDEALLCNALPGVDFHFYPTAGIGWIRLALLWLLDRAREVKLTFSPKRKGMFSGQAPTDKPSVLTLQEDNIRADHTLRGQPHWLDARKPPDRFNIYVVALSSILSIADDASQLSEAGLMILPASVFRSALKEMRGHKALLRVRQSRIEAIRAVLRVRGFAEKYFLLRLALLLRQAELMGAVALWLNVRVFLIRETYFPFADAMQLVAPDLNVTTIAYQYSNLGIVSPIMMSTADQFLIFSEMYKALYQTEDIAPREFIPTGYLYDGVASLVREKAQKHREGLMRSGATFIACYFDESVQNDRWGLVSREDHLGELHTLAKAVLSDPTFGIIMKSQFSRNTPSRLYSTDEIILAAKATGRYLELVEGQHRNDIYPTEAALVADLCISHKFGATAALETAIAGVRTVLLDPYGIKTLWDDLYAQADIEYESIDTLMVAIHRYRAGHADKKALGDWSPILSHFDPYRDGQSTCRLRTVIENAVQNARSVS
jgi:hypothetical protein